MLSISEIRSFNIDEAIDCLDTCGKWLHAKVLDTKIDNNNDQIVKVTYLDFSAKFDEWIASDSPRILKKFRSDSEFDDLKVGNIVDILDIGANANKWRECTVVRLEDCFIVVHYKGFSSKYDEHVMNDDLDLRIESVELGYAKSKKKGQIRGPLK